MALTQVTGPYPIFTDLDGTPLDDGYLYIGEINQDPEQNPIQVFWDANLTIPATQPIRTSNGYAYRNGTPALLYTGGEFSITIRNKREEFVLYSPVGYGFDPAAVSASVVKNDFVGDGVEVDFTLSSAPSTILATNVFINGVYQEKDSYTLSGNVITFSIAPPLNSSIEILTNETGVINTGNATAISYTLTAPGAVQQTVQTKLDQYISVKDFGAVGDGVADDAAAVQDAIDYVQALGGNLYFPKGVYLFGSQVTIDRTYAPSGSNFVGERNLIVSGYGAEIRTTGAISAFDVKGGWLPNHNCLIEGFTIYHRGNTTAVAGIRMIGAGLVTCREVSVAVSSSLPAGYAAFSMENSDPTNPDTGCFWNLIDQCSIRPWAGAEGFCDYGVKLMGAANATTLRNNTFSGSDTHVILMPHPGQTYVPNSVNIDGNFFEGPNTATAISLIGAQVVYHVPGTRITNNRFESLNTAVSLTGLGTTVQIPTYMSANYAESAVTNYVVNPSNIPIVMLDSALVGAPMGPMQTYNREGFVIENDDGAFNPLTLKTGGLNKGLELRRQSGNVLLGTLGYSTVAGGNGMQLAGSFTPDYRPLTIKGCQGIAARDTSANNLAGTSNFSAATSVTVSLPVAEADGNYLIFLMPTANQKLWVSARTASNFTVQSDVSSSNSFGWLLIRHL
jgi:hypothetical protein